MTFDRLLPASSDQITQIPPAPPREAYEGALKARAALQARVRSRFAEHQIAALAYPALFEHAPGIGDMADITWGGQPVGRVAALARSTVLAPCCGHPGLVVPAGLGDAGLPIGLEFDAPAGADRQLLGLGLAVEQALGPMPQPSEAVGSGA